MNMTDGRILLLALRLTMRLTNAVTKLRDDEKVFDLEKSHGICATIYACMYA